MEYLNQYNKVKMTLVLILIIMEDTHGEDQGTRQMPRVEEVLILIIMEDTHGALWKVLSKKDLCCLNPYYNGRYSWSVANPNFGKTEQES